MEAMIFTKYHYRDGLRPDDYRELTKKFAEIGNSPGVVAHYSRLDGGGGYLIQKMIPGAEDKSLEVTLQYVPWIDFESHPITTIEEAFPVIQTIYG